MRSEMIVMIVIFATRLISPQLLSAGLKHVSFNRYIGSTEGVYRP